MRGYMLAHPSPNAAREIPEILRRLVDRYVGCLRRVDRGVDARV